MNGNIVIFWLIVISYVIGFVYNFYAKNDNAFFFFLGGMAMLTIIVIWSFFLTK